MILGGGFRYSLCSPQLGEMIQFDKHMFQMGWNHQLENSKALTPNHILTTNKIANSYNSTIDSLPKLTCVFRLLIEKSLSYFSTVTTARQWQNIPSWLFKVLLGVVAWQWTAATKACFSRIDVYCTYIWGVPKIMVPQNGWFMMEHPIKMDDLGVPLF